MPYLTSEKGPLIIEGYYLQFMFFDTDLKTAWRWMDCNMKKLQDMK
jgi:hypothetical protein